MVRADSSGTSFVFSQHLSAISDDFSKSVGANTMPNWPVGTKSKGNEGVTASIMTHARLDRLHRVRLRQEPEDADGALENKSGKFVAATHGVGPGRARVRRRCPTT